jgi:hypothetical protein
MAYKSDFHSLNIFESRPRGEVTIPNASFRFENESLNALAIISSNITYDHAFNLRLDIQLEENFTSSDFEDTKIEITYDKFIQGKLAVFNMRRQWGSNGTSELQFSPQSTPIRLRVFGNFCRLKGLILTGPKLLIPRHSTNEREIY